MYPETIRPSSAAASWARAWGGARRCGPARIDRPHRRCHAARWARAPRICNLRSAPRASRGDADRLGGPPDPRAVSGGAKRSCLGRRVGGAAATAPRPRRTQPAPGAGRCTSHRGTGRSAVPCGGHGRLPTATPTDAGALVDGETCARIALTGLDVEQLPAAGRFSDGARGGRRFGPHWTDGHQRRRSGDRTQALSARRPRPGCRRRHAGALTVAAMRLLVIDDDPQYRTLLRHHVDCRWLRRRSSSTTR